MSKFLANENRSMSGFGTSVLTKKASLGKHLRNMLFDAHSVIYVLINGAHATLPLSQRHSTTTRAVRRLRRSQ